jgi:hypothetical protein
LEKVKKFIPYNLIIGILAVTAMVILSGLAFDFYFDLNDDVLMKEILSGAFTGTPSTHNIQMLYPISAVIAGIYRLFRNANVYSIFLCTFQFASIAIVFTKSMKCMKNWYSKVVAFIALMAFYVGVVMGHIVIVQYTITVCMMAAAAAFLLITMDNNSKAELVIAILLLWVAFLIRSEMLLLMLPFVGVAIFIRFIYRFTAVEEKEHKNVFIRFVILCAAILLGLLVLLGIHKIGYGSSEWMKFNSFFDNRTELYDFQVIPDYDENREIYRKLGLDKSEYQLLVNYNFGLDEEIDSNTLGRLAEYSAKYVNIDTTSIWTDLSVALKAYIYRLHYIGSIQGFEYPMTDFPWNVMALGLYVITFVLYLIPSKETFIWGSENGRAFKEDHGTARLTKVLISLVTLFACRTVLWGYILVRGRDPIRITHSLYYIEIIILIGLIMIKLSAIEVKKPVKEFISSMNYMIVVVMIMVAAIGLWAMPQTLGTLGNEVQAREEYNKAYETLYRACNENTDNFYLIDVYTSVNYDDDSTVTYSEKMFEKADNSEDNYMLMGGWAAKSPLYYEKLLNQTGTTSMEEALLLDNVYVVMDKDEDTEWLSEYYSDKGLEIEISPETEIAGEFVIYAVTIYQPRSKQ